MILEILSFYKGSEEEQLQFVEELEQLDDHQQLALRVYLEYDNSLFDYNSLHEAVELAEEAYMGQHDSGGDFAEEFMLDIEGLRFVEKIERLLGYDAWQQMWDYSLKWDFEFVEVNGEGFVIRQM